MCSDSLLGCVYTYKPLGYKKRGRFHTHEYDRLTQIVDARKCDHARDSVKKNICIMYRETAFDLLTVVNVIRIFLYST